MFDLDYAKNGPYILANFKCENVKKFFSQNGS